MYTVDLALSEGYHRLQVEHWEDYGWAALALVWLGLGDAVDNTGLSLTTGGNASWFAQTSDYIHDGDAARSGWVSDNQESWMEGGVTGPGVLRFYWRVSSERSWDYLQFYVDGQKRDEISGETDWRLQSYDIGPGVHALKWRYVKDGSVSNGTDCGWVDKVEFVSSVSLPLVLQGYMPYFEGPWEREDNDRASQANGPLRSGQDYYGYPDDAFDYFYLSLASASLGYIVHFCSVMLYCGYGQAYTY